MPAQVGLPVGDRGRGEEAVQALEELRLADVDGVGGRGAGRFHEGGPLEVRGEGIGRGNRHLVIVRLGVAPLDAGEGGAGERRLERHDVRARGDGGGGGGRVTQELQHARHVRGVGRADGGGRGVRAEVVVAVGEAEAALLGRGDRHRAVLEVRAAAEPERRAAAALVQPRELGNEIRGGPHRGDAVQLFLERRGARRLDLRGVHAGGVVIADLLVRRDRRPVGGRLGGEPIDDRAQPVGVAVLELGEAPVARLVGGERGAGEPAAVGVAVEVLAGSAGGVEVGRVEAMMLGGRLCSSAGGERRSQGDRNQQTASHECGSGEVVEYGTHGVAGMLKGTSGCAVRGARYSLIPGRSYVSVGRRRAKTPPPATEWLCRSDRAGSCSSGEQLPVPIRLEASSSSAHRHSALDRRRLPSASQESVRPTAPRGDFR